MWRLSVLMLAACQVATADPPPPKPPPPTTPAPHEVDLQRFHMHQNFDLVRAIERLLIRGKLDEAKRFAQAIATAPEEPAHGP